MSEFGNFLPSVLGVGDIHIMGLRVIRDEPRESVWVNICFLCDSLNIGNIAHLLIYITSIAK